VPSAIAPKADISPDGTVALTLTTNPTCSSLLPPNAREIDHYVFARRFDPLSTIEVPAQSLSGSISDLGLDRIDAIKLDTQGADLRILTDLEPELADTLLSIDAEPGLADFYVGEDLFVDLHKEVVRQGFWPVQFDMISTARIEREVMADVLGGAGSFRESVAEISLSATFPSPVAMGASYLRSAAWVAENLGPDGLERLWLLAASRRLAPFALEVAHRLVDLDPSAEAIERRRVSESWVRHEMINVRALASKLSGNRVRRLLTKHY
jgi:hypothetical protein